jgi:hypothetical protein
MDQRADSVPNARTVENLRLAWFPSQTEAEAFHSVSVIPLAQRKGCGECHQQAGRCKAAKQPRNEPTKLTTGGCSFRRAFGTKTKRR